MGIRGLNVVFICRAVRGHPAGGMAELGRVPAPDVPGPAAPHLHDGGRGLH